MTGRCLRQYTCTAYFYKVTFKSIVTSWNWMSKHEKVVWLGVVIGRVSLLQLNIKAQRVSLLNHVSVYHLYELLLTNVQTLTALTEDRFWTVFETSKLFYRFPQVLPNLWEMTLSWFYFYQLNTGIICRYILCTYIFISV